MAKKLRQFKIIHLLVIENRFWVDDSSLSHIAIGVLGPNGSSPVHLTAKTLLRQRSPQVVSVCLGAGTVEAALFTLLPALFTAA